MQLGIYSFAETSPDPLTGTTIRPAERLRDLLEEIEVAERVGLDVFGVGEHHRADFAASAPAVILAAAAARTSSIRLASAVTVLSSDDPVRVFQQFATLDVLSGGRAEVMAGRGSFIESFPLFGYDLDDYDALFAEKLDLLLKIRADETVAWSGSHRPALRGQGVYPRPLQAVLPVWVAVGGTPASVVRAGSLGLPLAIAIIGGEPVRFAPLVPLYRQAAADAGRDAAGLKVGIHSHGFVADTSAEASDRFFPYYAAMMTRLGRERGWPAMTRAQFDAGVRLSGALAVGSPDDVADKIVYHHEAFGHDRFLMQISVGALPHRDVLRAIELFGTEVVPRVRARLGATAAPRAS